VVQWRDWQKCPNDAFLTSCSKLTRCLEPRRDRRSSVPPAPTIPETVRADLRNLQGKIVESRSTKPPDLGHGMGNTHRYSDEGMKHEREQCHRPRRPSGAKESWESGKFCAHGQSGFPVSSLGNDLADDKNPDPVDRRATRPVALRPYGQTVLSSIKTRSRFRSGAGTTRPG